MCVRVQVVGVLGKGSFGFVQLVKHRDTGMIYALKGVSKSMQLRSFAVQQQMANNDLR